LVCCKIHKIHLHLTPTKRMDIKKKVSHLKTHVWALTHRWQLWLLVILCFLMQVDKILTNFLNQACWENESQFGHLWFSKVCVQNRRTG
jgi:hypothetical protein